LHEFEEAKHMPYVTSVERLAKKEGREEGARAELLQAIRRGLKARFGAAGSRLLNKVRAVNDLPRLRALADALITVETLQDFRELLDE
jgi:hypothetical protein